ncbi:Methylthioadenosine nucleosidase protein [Dioscorea alata]|uniref:Methylthioadenosine nucleosidase protein n=1 Tax=Dioscorea alata TaxID=55571 RepID=A0ACB7UA08_DIOAL|nr:Methylthioadenosine nucleosidase protein [Dioscorea alata]
MGFTRTLFNEPLLNSGHIVKAVTDIIDGEKPTAEEFIQNLVAVTEALDQAVTQVIDFISAKCLSHL